MAPIFQVDERPPAYHLTLLSLQYVLKFVEMLAVILALARLSGASSETMQSVLTFSLIAAAVATALQALPRVGSGYLLPASTSVAYYAGAVSAAKAGGFSLVAGMTLIGAAFQALITPLLRPWRFLLTPLVAGFLLILFGLWLGELGAREMLEGSLGQILLHGETPELKPEQPLSVLSGFLAIGILILMSLLRVLGGRRLRLYSLSIGLIIGWLASYLFGIEGGGLLSLLSEERWFALPSFSLPSWTWDPWLIGCFLLAALASSLGMVGFVASIQRAHLRPPDRIDMRRVRTANLISSLGLAIGGALGGVPQACEPGAVALQHASGAFSRYIGYGYALILLLISCSPKIQALLFSLPSAVNGAALVFLGASLIMAAGDLIPWKKLSSHHFSSLSLSLSLALAVAMLPALERALFQADLLVSVPILFTGCFALLLFGSFFSLINLVKKRRT